MEVVIGSVFQPLLMERLVGIYFLNINIKQPQFLSEHMHYIVCTHLKIWACVWQQEAQEKQLFSAYRSS